MPINVQNACERIKSFLLEHPHLRMVARTKDSSYYYDDTPVLVTEYLLLGYGSVNVEVVRRLLKERILRSKLVNGDVKYVAGINLTKTEHAHAS